LLSTDRLPDTGYDPRLARDLGAVDSNRIRNIQ